MKAEPHLPLPTLELVAVVSKYIVETETNPHDWFPRLQVAGTGLFSEAETIFGQRSKVRDANDR